LYIIKFFYFFFNKIEYIVKLDLNHLIFNYKLIVYD
jgi:hypothetical protein